MTNREVRRKSEGISEFLQLLVIDFFYFVKKQDESDESAHIKVNVKFKELNQRWKDKCHSDGGKSLGLKTSSFSDEVQKRLKPKQETKILSINGL